jgi:RimJ/RimL family protein N-acetyltransferase
MIPSLPPWPAERPAHGPIVLREFTPADVPMTQELSTDPYVPLIGTLLAHATKEQAQDWIDRQRGRLAEGIGYSFAIAEADTDRAVGGIGLWLRELPHGRASAGYFVAPSARGRGIAAAALIALTDFAWTISAVRRIELYIEPWNAGSIATAERSGYRREGLLRSHQEIGGRRRDMLLYATVREEDKTLPANADLAHLDRRFAVELNNGTWDLLDNGLSEQSPRADQEQALYAAYAAAHHWIQAGTVANHGRAEHLIATVAVATGLLDVAQRHAARCAELIAAHPAAFTDWDRAFAAEAIARIASRAGRGDAAQLKAEAQRLAEAIQNPEERRICLQRLTAPPW